MKISFGDLRKVDFNLGVVFMALWQERSVTLAAHRLSLSQAAVSAALTRLRSTCGDPLFVRTRSGMEPTPRARAMAEPLATQLASLHDLMLAQPTFDAGQSKRRFTLGMSDDFELSVGPRLAEILAQESPGVNIVLRRVNRYTVAQAFDDRDIDLAMVSGPLGRLSLGHELLGDLGFACLLDAERLGVRLPLSLETYAAMRHVLVSPLGREGIVDAALRAVGLSRHIQTALTHFSALPAFLMRLDAVATAPTPTCLVLSRVAGLQVCAPPLDLGRFNVHMLWRRDSAGDVGLDWMKQQFRRAFATIATETVPSSKKAVRGRRVS